MIKNDTIANEVVSFLNHQGDSKVINIPANTIISNEGEKCLNFALVLEGKIKVFKSSLEGKLITLYYINPNEGCVLTAAAIFNELPFPASAQAVVDCKVILFPAHLVVSYFDKSEVWRKFIFSLLSNKMASLITMVDDLAFHKLEDRLYSWISLNQTNDILDITHQELAEQMASTREVISRSLKNLEKKKLISLSRGKIILM